MLIYNQRRTKIVNLNAIQSIMVDYNYDDGTYDMCCNAQGELITLGKYKFADMAAIALNEILKAYDENKRIFFMPQDQEES